MLIWDIAFGVFTGGKASYQLKLGFSDHISHVAPGHQHLHLACFLQLSLVEGSQRQFHHMSTHQALQEQNIYSCLFNVGKMSASAPFNWLK